MNQKEAENLAISIRKMTRQGVLFKTLKRELTILGYWKNKPRGDSTAGRAKLREINALRKNLPSVNSHQISDSDPFWD